MVLAREDSGVVVDKDAERFLGRRTLERKIRLGVDDERVVFSA